jgi:hypothetical protein
MEEILLSKFSLVYTAKLLAPEPYSCAIKIAGSIRNAASRFRSYE